MKTFCNMCLLLAFMCSQQLSVAQSPPKPRNRNSSESKQVNLSRYVPGGFGQNAERSLGLKVIYSGGTSPKVTVSRFLTDSRAKAHGIKEFDWVLEVNGSAVGKIRNRHYEPWKMYKRRGDTVPELLVSLNITEGRKYYYPYVPTQNNQPRHPIIDDGFTLEKPEERTAAESSSINHSRYRNSTEAFDTYSPYELGANVRYSYKRGAQITKIKQGTAAESSGLRVGDMILEVDGAPIGIIGKREYSVWQQAKYSDDGKVELLIAYHDSNGETRYFYPVIQLAIRELNN